MKFHDWFLTIKKKKKSGQQKIKRYLLVEKVSIGRKDAYRMKMCLLTENVSIKK